MTTIAGIIAAHKGRAGSNGSWKVEKPSMNRYQLWHYSTLMLEWTEDGEGNCEPYCWSIGHGSVSDQHGMNTAFRMLGIPLYYSRRGGADIDITDAGLPAPYRHRHRSVSFDEMMWRADDEIEKWSDFVKEIRPQRG